MTKVISFESYHPHTQQTDCLSGQQSGW